MHSNSDSTSWERSHTFLNELEIIQSCNYLAFLMPNLIYVIPISESSTIELLVIPCKLIGGGGGKGGDMKSTLDDWLKVQASCFLFIAWVLWREVLPQVSLKSYLYGPQDINHQSFPGSYLWFCLLSEDGVHHLWIKCGRRKQLCFKFSAQERSPSQHRDCDSHLSPHETLLNEPLLPTAPTVDKNEGYKAECSLQLTSWP